MRVLNDDCIVSYSAPCGTIDGITLLCERRKDGKTCIEGRCRSKIRSNPKGFSCYEDIDCQEGLKCITSYEYFPFSSRCQEA